MLLFGLGPDQRSDIHKNRFICLLKSAVRFIKKTNMFKSHSTNAHVCELEKEINSVITVNVHDPDQGRRTE